MPRPPTYEAITTEFGRRIRARRIELGLSQEGLAERAGVHRTFAGATERGESNSSLTTIVKLAIALELDAGELVKGLQATRS